MKLTIQDRSELAKALRGASLLLLWILAFGVRRVSEPGQPKVYEIPSPAQYHWAVFYFSGPWSRKTTIRRRKQLYALLLDKSTRDRGGGSSLWLAAAVLVHANPDYSAQDLVAIAEIEAVASSIIDRDGLPLAVSMETGPDQSRPGVFDPQTEVRYWSDNKFYGELWHPSWGPKESFI